MRRRWWILGFLLPMLGVVALVALFPLGRVFWYSFHEVDLSGSMPTFVGLDNYRELFHDPDFRAALWNTALFTSISVSLELLIGLPIALLLSRPLRGLSWVQAAVLVPWVIPTVVSAQMWRWMLHDIYGVINQVGIATGILSHKIAWLARPGTAMAAIIAVDVWKTTPFVVLMLLAGLKTLDRELYEAAALDGASSWQQFRWITFPLLIPYLGVTLVFRTLDALRVFDLIYVMTGGGNHTETLAVYARRVLIDFQDLGYGSTVSVAILGVIGIWIAVYIRRFRLLERAT